MKIDGNEKGMHAMDLRREGKDDEARLLERELLNEIAAEGKGAHCSCQEKCVYHGNCYECVQLHRAHQDHLPFCMRKIVNDRLEVLSQITEGSFCAGKCECTVEEN